MQNKVLLILDLKNKNISFNIKQYTVETNLDILSLSPYATFLLEQYCNKFFTFHDFISTVKYRDSILEIEKRFIQNNSNIIDFNLLFRFFQKLINKFIFLEVIYKFSKKYDKVIYVSDNNDRIKYFQKFAEVKLLTSSITKIKKQNLFKRILNKNVISKVLSKYYYKINLKYDWLNYLSFFKYKKLKCDESFKYNIINKIIVVPKELSFFKDDFIFESQKNIFYKIRTKYYTPLTDGDNIFNYCMSLYYKSLNIPAVFYQHGSYFYKGLDLVYVEINLADINFVFNDYTKKLFEELGAKKVYSVGSILFNKPIKEKKKKYDFLYITQGHDYLGNLQYVDFPNSLHSFDGYELYQRHKNIIKLFGEKFKDKKILIRVHPCVVTTGVYVPLWELAESYPNVKIDVSIPIHNLIEKSKYIISDYFTSEFINRELHYKRDIILFQGVPTPLPEETIEDMKKMFILIDSVDDLEEKIKNIENITKNRKRYDDIIEYYSSKKCDTKKVVTEILERELNARN